MNQLLTVQEAGAQLRLSRVSIYRLIRDGALRSLKLGGCRRIPQREVDRLVDRRTRAGLGG
jgi:excisionase family DNA binding protein